MKTLRVLYTTTILRPELEVCNDHLLRATRRRIDPVIRLLIIAEPEVYVEPLA